MQYHKPNTYQSQQKNPFQTKEKQKQKTTHSNINQCTLLLMKYKALLVFLATSKTTFLISSVKDESTFISSNPSEQVWSLVMEALTHVFMLLISNFLSLPSKSPNESRESLSSPMESFTLPKQSSTTSSAIPVMLFFFRIFDMVEDALFAAL